MECSLFHNTKYQYGPACAYKERETDERSPKGVLVYYPLGSGKTLSAIHAARLFLDSNPTGKVLVITTKSNIQTSWSKNIQQYVHAEDVNLERIDVRNIDWWFSEENLPHYNKVIRLISSKSGSSRAAYVDLPWRTLIKSTSKKLRNEFKSIIEENNRSFLDACIPEGRFMFIVDECQQYLNSTSHQQLVANLCKHAYFRILLSATPLNDSVQERGLSRMLHTRNLENRILYVPPQENMVQVNHRYMGAKMTPKEIAHYLKNKKDDAYLTKGRQLCNTETKFTKISSKIGKKTVVYSFFRENGVDGFFNFLLGHTGSKFKSRHYLIFKINARKIHVKIFSNPEEDVQWFNRTSSKDKMLLITSKARLGISLTGVDTFHIMEPQWSYADETQAVGRATRMDSHKPGETVTVFHWVSTAGKYESSDEIVHQAMETKKYRTDRVLDHYAKMGTEYLSRLLDKFRIYSI
tara:strand:- start:7938 stop:9332 length:1395 start_codon:yes stop_codon:yes gene_type:complete